MALARDHFTSGFAALDACLTQVEQSQFKYAPIGHDFIGVLAQGEMSRTCGPSPTGGEAMMAAAQEIS